MKLIDDIFTPRRLRRQHWLLAVLLAAGLNLTGSLVSPVAAASFLNENEPNNTPAQATGLNLSSGLAMAQGHFLSYVEVDIYKYKVPDYHNVWITVDPGPSSYGVNVTLLDSDGSTELERDNHDGAANGCDGTLEGYGASIAGRRLTGGRTYYIKITPISGIEFPNFDYKLFVTVTTHAPVAEEEPNNSLDTANGMLSEGVRVNVRSGRVRAPGFDQDYYLVAISPGEYLHVCADGDPGRSGENNQLILDLMRPDGTFLFTNASPDARSIVFSDPYAVGFCFRVSRLESQSHYYVRVRHKYTGTSGLIKNYHLMVASSGSLAKSISSPAAPWPIDPAGRYAALAGAISIPGDSSYYSFIAPSNTKAWLTVDTGGVQNPGATTRDSLLALREGPNLIEQDDDDGSGNGCDSTLESTQASVIAGRTLADDHSYLIQVSAYSSTATLDPYGLFVVLTDAAPNPEEEPNNAPLLANPIVTVAEPIGHRTGDFASTSDVDYFWVYADEGSMLNIAADGDPERDGTGVDLVVELIALDGSTVLFSADSASVGTPGNPPGEGFCYFILLAALITCVFAASTAAWVTMS